MSLTRSPLVVNVLLHSSNKNLLLSKECRPILSNSRCIRTTSSTFADSSNQDYTISPVYHNKNPRNLEKLALARKRLGWQFQAPRKDYYHKLVIIRSHRHTEAWIEHCSGQRVLSASTKEWAVRNQLYSCNDVAASANIGAVLAQRCLESGVPAVFFDEADFDSSSEKIQAILQAFKNAKISLREPDMIVSEYKPGINYSGYNRYAEPKEWKEDYQDI